MNLISSWKNLKPDLRKNIIGIISVLIFFSALTAWMLMSKTDTAKSSNQSPAVLSATNTIDWKRYTIDQYGISFKYPSDWVVNVFDKKGENGVEELSCDSDSSKVYIKDVNSCNGKSVTTVMITIKDPQKTSDVNELSINTKGLEAPKVGTITPIQIQNEKYDSVSYEEKSDGVINSGFYVNNIPTGKNSIFKSVNVFGASIVSEDKKDSNSINALKSIVESFEKD